MVSKLNLSLTILLLVLGSCLLCNGIFHAVLYLFDDAPLMSGLRYLNWVSLALGALMFYVGLARVMRK